MFVSANDNLGESNTSSIEDEESISHRTSDKTVSELLSSYYDVSQRSSAETTRGQNEKDSNLKKQVALTDKDFLSQSFDADYHFDNLLRHNSISDIISLLRKLERETRQLTAGKQLLIYDNYECLFSALDTVQTINRELDQVQNHLRTLKTSQVKASSKDITSKYGIRDKFVQISHLSKASEVFDLLSNLCNTLASFSTSNTLLYLKKDESSKVLTYTRQEILSFCSRVYYLFKYFQEDYNFLFRTYYPLLTEVVSKNASSLLSEDDPLDQEGLLEACKSLRGLSFDKCQLLGLFLFNLSSLLEKNFKNVFINYTNKDFSFVALCKEVFESLLKVVYNAVSNNKCNEFFKDIVSSKEGNHLCFHCSQEVEPEFEYGDSGLFQGFRFVSKSSCKCPQEDLRREFVLYYTQASFFVFSYLLTSNKYTLNSKEVGAGLVVLFEVLSTLRVETTIQRLFLDQSLKWVMAVCVLYLQHVFFTFYDSVIAKSMSFLNGSYNLDLNPYFLTLYEKALNESREVVDFARDFSKSVNNNFDQVLSSVLVVYTSGFKYIFRVIYDNINLVKLKDKENRYLDSVLVLKSMRTANDKDKTKIQEEYLKTKNLEEARSNLSTEDEEGGELSTVEFMNKKVKSQLEKFKFERSQHKTYTKNLLSSLMKLEGVFGSMVGAMERNCREAYKAYTTETMTLELRPKVYGEFEDLKRKFKEQTHKMTSRCRPVTIFEDVNIDENTPFVNMIIMAQNYNRTNEKYFPMGSKRFKEKSNDSKGEKEDKSEEEKVHKNHFERFNISVNELANEVVEQIMLEYLTKSLKILRFVFESLENGKEVVEEGIKDFTILLSEVLQDLNMLTISQSTTENELLNKQLDKALNTSINESDISGLVNLHKFKFNTSRDMCLKLFTLHIVQALSQYKKTYMVEEGDLSRLFEGLKQQILIIFKKNLDLFIMQSVWEKVLNLS